MPDPDHNNEQQPQPSDPAQQPLPLDPAFSEELEELAKKLDATEKDVPAVPSNLLTHEEVSLQIAIEGLRVKREKRIGLTWARRSFVYLLCLAALIALVATAVVIVGLSRGEKELVIPALATLSGAGATGALLCRAYINGLDPDGDERGSASG